MGTSVESAYIERLREDIDIAVCHFYMYHIYPKNWDTLITYHTSPKILHSAASDLGLHCLLGPVCPNT